MFNLSKSRFSIVFFMVALSSFSPVSAGFLEMPEITEAPTLKRQSMLRDMDIPNVRERNPDPDAGPRLAVSSFRLQGIVEYPELGITKKDLDKLIESIRHDLMDEDKLLASGYTPEEIAEVSDMLVEIEDETRERHVSTLELQKLVWLIRDQRSKRGITLGQIESIADKITKFYRERGFILAKAYIPQQQVRDGVVNLTLLLGMLGEINTVDNNLYDDSTLASVFDDDLTRPVTSTVVEENLYLINDFPGINVQGFFEPGSQVGDSRLNIKVNSETRYTSNLRYDNHGTEETGEQRLYADFLINNPIGNADVLQLSFLNSFSPDNTTYYEFRYATTVYSPRLTLGLSSTTNQFVLDQDQASSLSVIDLSGDTSQTSIGADYKITRSRKKNHYIGLKIENIKSELDFEDIPDNSLFDEEVENTSLYYNYDVLDEGAKVLHQGNITLTSGKILKREVGGLDESYSLLTSDYTFLTFVKVPFTDTDSRLILRSSLQVVDTAVTSVNQFSLAGATRAKAYIPNLFSADNAVYVGLEWVFNSPEFLDFKVGNSKFSEISQPFLFADASYGIKKTIASSEDDETGQITDIGFGIRLSYLDDFKGNLQFAFPISNKFEHSDITEVDDSVRVVFDFQYNF